MDPIWRAQFGFEYQRQLRPVMAREATYKSGQREIWHSHEQAQLFYATNGAVRALTDKGSWMLPSMHAIWLPPGVGHELHAIGDVSAYSLYLEPNVAPWLWPACRVVQISPMLHELIMALATESIGEFKNAAAAKTVQPGNYPPASRAALVVPLLLHDLQASETTTHGSLPLPSDRRLRAICSELLAMPSNDDTLDHWSETVGASARTLGRLFRQETGLTFGQWRQQLRLVEAVSRLALGDPVSKVADELGYQSSSGFIAMFRRALGETPHRYLKKQ